MSPCQMVSVQNNNIDNKSDGLIINILCQDDKNICIANYFVKPGLICHGLNLKSQHQYPTPFDWAHSRSGVDNQGEKKGFE